MSDIVLCDVNSCTQCQSCVQSCPKACITMTEARDGFYVPQIDTASCIGCGICLKACHVISDNVSYNGPLKTYACWTSSKSDREKSSSGGAFSIIARKILSMGGVVFGAYMNNGLQVRHIWIDKEDDLYKLQGSKYVQSSLSDTYSEVHKFLLEKVPVLFTGTPCQISGLLSFLRKPYDDLYTCDIICHGVPSQKSFDTYIDKIGIREICTEVGFRYTKGWGYQLTYTDSLSNNKKILWPPKAYYLKAFSDGLMTSEACYSCRYSRVERVSDVTLADFWGIGAMEPFDYPTRQGVSLLLVNRERIIPLLNDCQNLMKVERQLQEAINGNYNLTHATQRPEGRDSYYMDSQRMSVRKLTEKYAITASCKDYLRIIKQVVFSWIYR